MSELIFLQEYTHFLEAAVLTLVYLLYLRTKIDTTMLKVEIINRSHHALPTYATPLSAGMDLRANLTVPIVL